MVAAMTGTRVGRVDEVRQAGEWRCARCARYLGRVIGTILHEPNGDRSVLPCIRHCPKCGRQNVRLQ
jgi:hypothetical protein